MKIALTNMAGVTCVHECHSIDVNLTTGRVVLDGFKVFSDMESVSFERPAWVKNHGPEQGVFDRPDGE